MNNSLKLKYFYDVKETKLKLLFVRLKKGCFIITKTKQVYTKKTKKSFNDRNVSLFVQ